MKTINFSSFTLNLCSRPLFALSLLLGSTQASAAAPSKEMLGTLSSSECWQSSAFNSFGAQMVPIVHKKWRFVANENLLLELTNSSINRNSSGSPSWVSKKIDLTQELRIEDFTNLPFNVDLTFTKLANSQILLEGEMGFKFKTVLFPSPCNPKSGMPARSEIGIGSTPFGLLSPQIPYSDFSKSSYIHHDKSSTVMVQLDLSFPAKFRQAVRKALRLWNRAIGRQVYILSSKDEKIDPLSCLTSNSLCISWEGSDDLGWIGWGGITSMIFDPLSGAILGATVVMSNFSSQVLEPTPAALAPALEHPSMKSRASIHLQKEQFKKYRHTHPEALVTHILMHEIGHANGLRHDFSASTEANSVEPSSSVMEYLPFGVAHKMNHFGARDLRRLDVLYRRGGPAKALSDCSDESLAKGTDPSCAKNDVGRPLDWYKMLCEKGDRGVFTSVIEQNSGLPQRSYLSVLQNFISNPVVSKIQESDATDFLCRQTNLDEIKNVMARDFGKIIDCSRN